jgi:hypothetical protein
MIIGLVGLIGSGKDTAADYLVNQHGWRRDSFAAPLKDAVATIFGWDRELLEGRTKQSREWREQTDVWWASRLGILQLTPRWVLQQWGTEVGRQGFHDDIWVASLENRIRQSKDNVVITDCRFPNEIEVIQRSGGRVFRIQRGAEPSWVPDALAYLDFPAGRPPRDIPHASEWSWMASDLDGVIDNNGTIQDLCNNMDQVIDKFWPDAYNVVLRNKETV